MMFLAVRPPLHHKCVPYSFVLSLIMLIETLQCHWPLLSARLNPRQDPKETQSFLQKAENDISWFTVVSSVRTVLPSMIFAKWSESAVSLGKKVSCVCLQH